MPSSSRRSCSAAILCMHEKIRHLKYEDYWPQCQLSTNREKIQILPGVLYSSILISLLWLLLHCWGCPLREAGEGKGRAAPCFGEVLCAPHCDKMSVVNFGGCWDTAWSQDKLGLPRYGPFPRRWEGRKEAPMVLQRPPRGHAWSGERWALNCCSTGRAQHSWNWEIRICQCVI